MTLYDYKIQEWWAQKNDSWVTEQQCVMFTHTWPNKTDDSMYAL